MKKSVLLIISVLICAVSFAQVPEGVNYQAIARDQNGSLMSNVNIAVQFSIVSSTAEVLWQEEHVTTTNQYGLFNLIVGEGTSTGVGTVTSFDAINWGAGARYLRLEIDENGGSNYVELGETQLMSVPYALYSKSSGETDNNSGSIIILNDGIPNDSIGNNGDIYIDTLSGDLYGPKDDSWPFVGNIIGADGIEGPVGPAGLSLLSGQIPPLNSVGDSGDFYLDTATYLIYGPKDQNGWPVGFSLIGPQGFAGSTMLAGAGAPAGSIGTDGDFYLDTANSIIYGPLTAGTWPVGVSILGGNGADGNMILTGSAAPVAGVADSGDFYIDTTTYNIYGPFNGTSWGTPTSLIGSFGIVGTQGQTAFFNGSIWDTSSTLHNSGNRIGIGTNTPSEILTINNGRLLLEWKHPNDSTPSLAVINTQGSANMNYRAHTGAIGAGAASDGGEAKIAIEGLAGGNNGQKVGVYGEATGANGAKIGTYGYAEGASDTITGTLGEANGSGGIVIGTYGSAYGTTPNISAGVAGENSTSASSISFGGIFTNDATGSGSKIGVQGSATGDVADNIVGVAGEVQGTGSASKSGLTATVTGQTNGESFGLFIQNVDSADIAYGAMIMVENTTDSAKVAVLGRAAGNSNTGQKFGVIGQATDAGDLNFGVFGSAQGALGNYAGYFDEGNVHVTNILNVDSSIFTKHLRVNTGASSGAVLTSDAVGNASWVVPALTIPDWQTTGNVLLGSEFLGTTNATDLIFKVNGNETFRLNTAGEAEVSGNLKVSGTSTLTGNVAMSGTLTTAGIAAFSSDVITAGTTETTNFRMTGTAPALGFALLATDAFGNAAWTDISGLDPNNLQEAYSQDGTTGNTITLDATAGNISYTNGSVTILNLEQSSGRVGIGTSSAIAQLDVASATVDRTLNVVNSSTAAAPSYGAVLTNDGAGGVARYGAQGLADGAGTNRNVGLFGEGMNNTNENIGLLGWANGSVGVQKGLETSVNGSGTGASYGVYSSNSSTTSGLTYAGYFANTGGTGAAKQGVYAFVSNATDGSHIGVNGVTSGNTSAALKYGIIGNSSGTGANNYGVHGTANGASNNYAIYGVGTSATNVWAGYFEGKVQTTRELIVGTNQYVANNSIVGDTSIVGAFTMNTGGAANYILTSDAAGNGTWQDASALGLQNLQEVYDHDGLTGNALTLSATSGDISIISSGGSNMLILDESTGQIGVGGGITIATTQLEVTQSSVGGGITYAGTFLNTGTGTGGKYGVAGVSQASSGNDNIGTYGVASGSTTINTGVSGLASGISGERIGVLGAVSTGAGTDLTYAGVFKNESTSSGGNYGSYSTTSGATTGINYGAYGKASGGTSNYSIYGEDAGGAADYAGYFLGKVNVTGNLSVGGNSIIAGTENVTGQLTVGAFQMNVGGTAGYALLSDGSGTGVGVWTDVSTLGIQNLQEVYYKNGNTVTLNAPTGDVSFISNSITLLYLQESTSFVGIGAPPANPNTQLDVSLPGSFATSSEAAHFRNLTIGTGDKIGGRGEAATSGGGTNRGLYGGAQNGASYNTGVYGTAGGNLGERKGVQGQVTGVGTTQTYGGYFNNISTSTSSHYGVYSVANGSGGTVSYGTFGEASGATVGNYGIYGTATGGTSTASGAYGGVSGTGGQNAFGGEFISTSSTTANAYGVSGDASGAAANNYGVYGNAINGTSTNFAGYFENGNVYIENNLGVGISVPSSHIEVEKASATIEIDATSGDPSLILSEGSVNKFKLGYNTATNYFNIQEGATERFIIEDGTGDVGIGTNAPNQKLDVEGGIEIDNEYTYESAQIRVLGVQASGFRMQAADANCYLDGFASGNSCWITGGVAGTNAFFASNVYLPDGAIVTELSFTAHDGDATYDIYAEMKRMAYGGSGVFNVATTATSTGSAGLQVLSSGAISQTIDNDNNSYFIYVHTKEATSDLRVHNIKITYTVTKTD